MNRANHSRRWLAGVAISVLVSVVVVAAAANLFPDQTWNALNSARELSNSFFSVYLGPEPPKPPSVSGFRKATYGDPVMARLATVDRFAFGGVGFAGVTSQGELDYESLMARPSALALFEQVYREGNLQGKSYALSGIHELNPERFKELAASLNTSTDEVVTQQGCVITHERLIDIVKRIEKEQIRVKYAQPDFK